MNWIDVFNIAAGVTSAGAFAALLAAMYFHSQSEQERSNSIRSGLVGSPYSPKDVEAILKHFQSDEGRLKALTQMTQGDFDQAKQLLEKVQNADDLVKTTVHVYKDRARRAFVAM